MKEKTAIIGGDMRQTILAELMSKSGCEVGIYGLPINKNHSTITVIKNPNELTEYGSVILPMPTTQDGEHINAPLCKDEIKLDDIMQSISAGAVVMGGKLSTEFVGRYKQLSFYDYLEREDFAIKNSVATAEGAIAIAINETPFTIWNSKCLVTGYGRIGKTLSKMLTALGASVDVSIRKCSDAAWAECNGCGVIATSQLIEYIQNYDVVFNTVPHRIFDRAILEKVGRSAYIIDLASKPGGAGVGLDKGGVDILPLYKIIFYILHCISIFRYFKLYTFNSISSKI